MAVSPAEDPQFLAFLRASGAQEADLANVAAFQQAQLKTGADLRAPQYDQQLRDGQRNIGDNFAARGVYGSGVMAQRQNEQAGDVQAARQADQITTQGNSDQIDVNLAQQIADLRRRQAEQGLNYTASTTLGNARGVLSPLGA